MDSPEISEVSVVGLACLLIHRGKDCPLAQHHATIIKAGGGVPTCESVEGILYREAEIDRLSARIAELSIDVIVGVGVRGRTLDDQGLFALTILELSRRLGKRLGCALTSEDEIIGEEQALGVAWIGSSGEADRSVIDYGYERYLPSLAAGRLSCSNAPDSPLVTVIVRSVDRPELRDALLSIACQTWFSVEVVVVSAIGPAHSVLASDLHGVAVRLVNGSRPLARAEAANVGLMEARGDFLLFLDDDDLLLPAHIERLVSALGSTGRAAYAGVRMVDQQDRVLRVFDEDWSVPRLRGGNFLPIHAVLFSKSLVSKNACCFDESLSCLEDWDFWQQLAMHVDFVHVAGVSAIYRYGLGRSALSQLPDQNAYLDSREKIFKKWKNVVADREWVGTFNWFEGAVNHFREMAQSFAHDVGRVQAEAVELGLALDREQAVSKRLMREREAVERQREILQRRSEHLEQRCLQLNNQLEAERHQVDAIRHSTSWRLTMPLRVSKRLLAGEHKLVARQLRYRILALGRTVYRMLPPRHARRMAHLAYRSAGALFTGLPSYETWRRATAGEAGGRVYSSVTSRELVRLDEVDPLLGAEPGSIAIHVHLFYPDLATEFRHYLDNMPFRFDLYVSVMNETALGLARDAFGSCSRLGLLEVEIVPNRGRDIGPMVCTFGQRLREYDFVAHFHTKKSLYNNGATDGWRDYLLSALVGSDRGIRQVFRLLQSHSMVFPQTFWRVPYPACTWLANAGVGRALLARLNLPQPDSAYFNFPAGSMFWARGELLRPLFDAGITIDEFAPEQGQTDGTLAHAIERALGQLHRRGVMTEPAILKDMTNPGWSAWRFDQYVERTEDNVAGEFAFDNIRVVVFDVFDTLLMRRMIDPEHTKRVVALRLGDKGTGYLNFRSTAEIDARQRHGKDIGLDEIFHCLRELAGWDEQTSAMALQLEREVELASVVSREGGLALLQHALMAGKRVLLASDMYLDAATVEEMLTANGVFGWSRLYLSSEVGVRKDTGMLYELIFSEEQLTPAEVVMVGDNERSDLQIPGDLGCRTVHLLRHVDLAHGLPRFAQIVDMARQRDSLDWSISLGVITSKFFSPVFFGRLDPSALFGRSDPFSIGFGVLGPVVLAFCQWLGRKAADEGVSRLWFLAREGEFLGEVYSKVVDRRAEFPAGHYMRVSRRAVGVPAIVDSGDIDRIAGENFGPADLRMFFDERFGVVVSNEDIDALATRGLLPKDELIMVRSGDVSSIRGLLNWFEPRILANAKAEVGPLFDYFDSLGFRDEGKHSVVDVGYAGSIQYWLNRLPCRPVHGYYMMTNDKANEVQRRFDVDVSGCYFERLDLKAPLPGMYRDSFMLEKLLSADDAQVKNYLSEGGEIVPVFKTLSEAEMDARPVRAEIRRGAMAFVDDLLEYEHRLGLSVDVPTELARALFEAFTGRLSEGEREVLLELQLDDHYCGRGVVR